MTFTNYTHSCASTEISTQNTSFIPEVPSALSCSGCQKGPSVVTGPQGGFASFSVLYVQKGTTWSSLGVWGNSLKLCPLLIENSYCYVGIHWVHRAQDVSTVLLRGSRLVSSTELWQQVLWPHWDVSVMNTCTQFFGGLFATQGIG